MVTIAVQAIHSFCKRIQSITCQASGRPGATTPLLHEGATREAAAPPLLPGTTRAVRRCSRQGAPVSAAYLHEKLSTIHILETYLTNTTESIQMPSHSYNYKHT
jgi:hypothetical protein